MILLAAAGPMKTASQYFNNNKNDNNNNDNNNNDCHSTSQHVIEWYFMPLSVLSV